MEKVPEKYVLYFGRYSEEKGINTLIEVCKQLPNIPFIFAGTGPLEDKVNSLENVKNVGFQAGEELNRLIREAWFTVYPSEWYENCPFSVMESQVYGTPILASDIGGIPELLGYGKNGELFESGNASKLKKCIKRLWEDQRKIQLYSKKCFKANIYNDADYYKRILKIYNGL